MNKINEKELFLKNSQDKSQETIDELNKECFKQRVKPSEMLARFQWYRQNGLPIEINSLIEKLAIEETGKKRGRIQQLTLEDDFPKLKKELDNIINNRKELERLESLKPRYYETYYQDYDDYYQSSKSSSEETIKRNLANLASQAEKDWESFAKLTKMIKEVDQEVNFKANELLGRQSFYRQNNLPVELNQLIEKSVETPSEYYTILKEAYLKTTEPSDTFTWIIDMEQGNLKDLEANCQDYLANIEEALNTEMLGIQELREKARKEKEIVELLAKEIKEHQEKWENYLNTKPLPALPKSKIKVLGNKIKAQFQQVIKPKELPKPIKNNLFNVLLMTGLLFRG